jgi:hypothetical protein
MRSRWLGAVVGGVGGVVIGLGITFYLYRNAPEVSWTLRIVVGVATGAVGAFLGSLSGLLRD